MACNHNWQYTADHFYEYSFCGICKGGDGKLFGPLYPRKSKLDCQHIFACSKCGKLRE